MKRNFFECYSYSSGKYRQLVEINVIFRAVFFALHDMKSTRRDIFAYRNGRSLYIRSRVNIIYHYPLVFRFSTKRPFPFLTERAFEFTRLQTILSDSNFRAKKTVSCSALTVLLYSGTLLRYQIVYLFFNGSSEYPVCNYDVR